MQNSNTRLAAQLVTRQLHPEKAGAMIVQPTIPAGQTSSQPQVQSYQEQSGQANAPPGNPGQANVSAQPHMQQPGQYQGQSTPIPTDPQYAQSQDTPGQTNVPGQPGQSNLQHPEQYQVQGSLATSHQPVQQHPTDPLMQTNTQENIPDTSTSNVVPSATPYDDFGDVYRTGNFGKHFGKVNVYRGKRWLLTHGILSLFMSIFTLAASVMMKDYKESKSVIKSLLLAFSWLATVGDWLLVAIAAYMLFKLSTLKRPLTTLVTLRSAAAFNFAFNMFFLLVGLFTLFLKEDDFVQLTAQEAGSVKTLFVLISILMVVKCVTGYSFVFLWWGCPACCHAIGEYCVFDEGEELAPGVDNSAGAMNVVAVGEAAQAFGEAMNRM